MPQPIQSAIMCHDLSCQQTMKQLSSLLKVLRSITKAVTLLWLLIVFAWILYGLLVVPFAKRPVTVEEYRIDTATAITLPGSVVSTEMGHLHWKGTWISKYKTIQYLVFVSDNGDSYPCQVPDGQDLDTTDRKSVV